MDKKMRWANAVDDYATSRRVSLRAAFGAVLKLSGCPWKKYNSLKTVYFRMKKKKLEHRIRHNAHHLLNDVENESLLTLLHGLYEDCSDAIDSKLLQTVQAWKGLDSKWINGPGRAGYFWLKRWKKRNAASIRYEQKYVSSLYTLQCYEESSNASSPYQLFL